MNELIMNKVEDIAQTLVKKNAGFFDRLGGNFIIAGGVFKFLKFSKESDVDIFPVSRNWDIATIKGGIDVLNSSKNATTFSYFGLTLQLCNYRKECLTDLIDSFDFNYCQCGAEYKDNKLVNVNFSDAFAEWIVCREVKYTGSEYPLSSMIRLVRM
jgi:hypothetical protein